MYAIESMESMDSMGSIASMESMDFMDASNANQGYKPMESMEFLPKKTNVGPEYLWSLMFKVRSQVLQHHGFTFKSRHEFFKECHA